LRGGMKRPSGGDCEGRPEQAPACERHGPHWFSPLPAPGDFKRPILLDKRGPCFHSTSSAQFHITRSKVPVNSKIQVYPQMKYSQYRIHMVNLTSLDEHCSISAQALL
jgi:hypothetical protein